MCDEQPHQADCWQWRWRRRSQPRGRSGEVVPVPIAGPTGASYRRSHFSRLAALPQDVERSPFGAAGGERHRHRLPGCVVRCLWCEVIGRQQGVPTDVACGAAVDSWHARPSPEPRTAQVSGDDERRCFGRGMGLGGEAGRPSLARDRYTWVSSRTAPKLWPCPPPSMRPGWRSRRRLGRAPPPDKPTHGLATHHGLRRGAPAAPARPGPCAPAWRWRCARRSRSGWRSSRSRSRC